MKKKNNKTGKINNKPDSGITQPHKLPAVHTSFNFLPLANNGFVHIACLVFLILIIYANTFNAPFQWDEKTFIVENPIIKDLHYFAIPSEAKGFELYEGLIKRYIGYLTFAFNYKLDGLEVTGYHIVNVIIHIANTVLVYLLVLLTFRTPYFNKKVNGEEVNSELIKAEKAKIKCGPFSQFTIHDSRSLIAFFSAALFAVHPLQTEAVTYVFQRFASLVAFFYLLSLVAYIKARLTLTTELTVEAFNMKKPKKFFGSAQSSSLCFRWLILSFLSAILAMKTKENAFTLPLIIALYEFCFFSHLPRVSFSPRLRFPLSQRLLYLAPMLLTLIIIPLTLMSTTGTYQLDPGSYGASVYSRSDYFLTQFRVIITYLRLLFFPAAQNLNYDYPVFKTFFELQVMLSFAFLASLFAFGIYLIIGNRLWAMGNRIKAKVKEDDSRSYQHPPTFRLIGFGILWFFITISVESSIVPLPMLIDEYRVYLPSIGLIVSAVAGVFLVFPRLTTSVSRPSTSRFLIVALVIVIGGLSVATHLRNELWTDKIRLWEDVVEKSPDKATVHLNLGYNYQERNMLDKAMEQYLIAIRLAPDLAMAHYNLGFVYTSLNMLDKAVEQYLIAIKLAPRYAAEAHNNLGVAYKFLNMPGKAEEEYLAAIRLKPDNHEYHYNLGVFYKSHDMPDKAMEQYLIAVKLKPDYAVAHNNLGSVYMALNQPDKAEEEFMTAIRLRPDLPAPHFGLGLAYYKTGQMEKAQREIARGLEIMPDNQEARELLKKITERL